MLVDSPIAVSSTPVVTVGASAPVREETAPQIASKVSETVSSSTPEQTINDIMARLMHK